VRNAAGARLRRDPVGPHAEPLGDLARGQESVHRPSEEKPVIHSSVWRRVSDPPFRVEKRRQIDPFGTRFRPCDHLEARSSKPGSQIRVLQGASGRYLQPAAMSCK